MTNETTVQELIGVNIRDLRRAAGVTQAELGQAMTDGFGFRWENGQAVAAAEAGKRRFQLDELLALAAYFDVSPMALLVAPGTLIDETITITTNGRRIPVSDYAEWWLADKQNAPVGVIDRMASRRSLERPWARLRRKGASLPDAYESSRQARLSERPTAAYPGPVVRPAPGVVDPEIGTAVPPWGQTVKISIPQRGYTARDEIEREILLKDNRALVVDRRTVFEGKHPRKRRTRGN